MTTISLKEFSDAVGVPYGTVKRWVKEGMPVVRFGYVRVEEEKGRAWMKEKGRKGATVLDAPRVVYFAQRADGAIKIGWSGRPRDRVYELRSRYGCEVTLLSAHRAPRGVERRLHEHFAGARVDGEWFTPTPELVALAGLQDTIAWTTEQASLAIPGEPAEAAPKASEARSALAAAGTKAMYPIRERIRENAT